MVKLILGAIDQRTKEKVAIKKLYRPFQSLIHAKRAYRELRLLRHIQHENVRHQDLSHIMKKGKLTDKMISYILYQILQGLKDLKPSNLAVNQNCELKEMTGYVVTRWYRAPEIILNWMHYTQTVDMWSVGCILAELITGHVLFPGKDCILYQSLNVRKAKRYIQALPPQVKRNFREAFPNMDKKVVDLLEKMLVLDPDRRLTAREGLSHRYLEEYHDPESEPDSMPYDDSFENLELPVEEWRSLIHMEIMTFDPDNPRQTAT
ncbi:UNVERIFIED_CONTAM: hypothetical protein FKN15_005565 [Acipenser sinensis]